MIGVILTGHNHFGSGVGSSIQMVGGQQDNFKMVDFTEDMNEETLTQELKKAIAELDACDSIIICCDLMGGSPFKMAATLSLENKKVKVLYGVNLGMMLEMILSREFVEDVDGFVNNLIDTGRQAMGVYEFKEYVEEVSDDGI